jgi:ribonuclease HI
MKIEVYTDGSATTKDKPGGWAFVMVIDGQKHSECSGHMGGASNNDAEMEAAIQGLAAALKHVKDETDIRCGVDGIPDYSVTLCSDSELIIGWTSGRYRFKQLDKIAKYNQLQFLAKRLKVQTRWVKGHSGDEHNERCDKLANEARLGVNRKKDIADAIAAGKTLIGSKKSGTLCVWYKNQLKVIDLETNIVENYERSVHGSRGGVIEIREEKSR